MKQSHPFRILLGEASDSLTQGLKLLALLNLGMVQQLASRVLSTSDTIQHFCHVDNCL
jgi:hypothetical protein